MITRNNLIEILKQNIPEFQINPDWIESNLGYPIINDLGRYLCEQMLHDDIESTRKGINFLILCIKQGDVYIRQLVSECLETFDSCEQISKIRDIFGPELDLLWRESNTESGLNRPLEN